MGRKFWKVFLILTLVVGMTVSFGTSNAEAEEPTSTEVTETTEPQTTTEPSDSAESTAPAETPSATPESAQEPEQIPVATEEPAPQPTEVPVDNSPKTYDLSVDQKDWVTEASLEVADQNGNYHSLNDLSEIPEYASFKLHVSFKVPDYQDGTTFPGIKDTDVIRFQLPEGIRSLTQTSGTIKDASWNVENGYVVLKFNSDFLTNNHYGASGSLSLEGTLNDRITEGGESSFPVIHFLGNEYGNKGVVKRTNGIGNIDLKKTAVSKTHQDNSELGAVQSAHYQIQVKAGDLSNEKAHNNTDLHNVVINDAFQTYEKYAFDAKDYAKEDELEKYISYQNINVKITGPEGESVVYQNGAPVTDGEGRSLSVIDGTDSAHKSFQLNGELHPDEIIVIDYDANIDEEMYESDPHGYYKNNVNDKSITKSGDADTNGKAGGAERSWIDRRVSNTASVKADGSVGDTDTCEKANSTDTDWFLTFKKTWLYTGADEGPEGGPHSGHISNLQISVNEGDRMPLGGYVLEDDLLNQKNPQKLISGITITDEDNNRAVIGSVSLEDLQNGVTTGAWAGSSEDKIHYTFSDGMNHHYRFHFITQGDKDKTEDIQAYNTATLKEPAGRGSQYDDYGAAKEWTTKGATVTKHSLLTDTDNGTIQWQTTIDDGINVDSGSHYDDYVYWDRTDRSYQENVEDNKKNDAGNFKDTEVKSQNSSDKSFHQLDKNTLNLKVTAGVDHTELQEGTDYKLTFLSDEEVNSAISDYWNHGLTSGFRITFLRKIEHGPVLITYSSKAAFDQVNYQANFRNIAKYWPQENSNPFTAEDNVCFEANGSLKKTVSSNDGNRITWSLRVNEKKNATKAGYTIEDTIPEGLNFDLHDFQPAELYYATDTNSNVCDNDRIKNAFDADQIVTEGNVQKFTGSLFDASYDKDTKKLLITIKPEASDHIFTAFNYTTTVSAKTLKKAISEGKKVEFKTPAKLYSNGANQPLIAKSDAWAWIEADVLSKTETYNQNTAPYVNYEITVNSKEAELAPDTHEVYVQDSGMQAPLIFQRGTLKVKDKYNNVYTEGKEADAEKHTYVFESKDNGGFQITVPDKTALTISYSAYAPGVSGDQINTSNSVALYANGEEFTHTAAGKESEQWITPSAKVNGTTRVQIRKTDEKGNALKGAVFTLYEATGENFDQNGKEIGTFTSDKDGIAYTTRDEYGYAHLPLEQGKVYLIRETEAPAYQDNDGYYAVNQDYVKKFYVTKDTDNSNDPNIQNMRNHGVILMNHGVQMELDECADPAVPTTSVKATKVWDDNNNQDGKRTDVTFHLNASINNDTEAAKKFINADDLKDKTIKKDAKDLTVTWNNLPEKDSHGNTIVYTVTEDKVDGYEDPKITGDQTNGFTVTNTHHPETTSVSGHKNWDDSDYLGKTGYQRPNVISVRLSGVVNGEEVESRSTDVTADQDWNYSFDSLPKYHNGTLITYTVTETAVDGKSPSKAGYLSTGNGYDITNQPKKSEKDEITPVSLTITKRDGKSADHGVLTGAVFKAVKDGENTSVTGTTNENGQTTLNFTEEGTYILTETKAPEGYTISDEMQKGLKIEVTKSGADQVKLEVKENESFFTWFFHLFFGKDEKNYTYSYQNHSGVLEVTDDPETTSVHAKKVWKDNDNQDGKRQDVTLHLYQTTGNTSREISFRTITSGDSLKVCWDNLPAYEDGQKVSYQVTEDPMKDYDSNVTYDEKKGFIVTNTHQPDTTSVSGKKIWNDEEYLDQNGYTRPESVEVTVTGTVGNETVETESKTVTVNDNWNYTFDSLPKYHKGQEIAWTVSETKTGDQTPSKAGYESLANGYDITNTPKKNDDENITPVSLTVIKRDKKSSSHGLLKDTTFQLKKESSEKTISGTTNENGQVTMSLPEEGTYILTETKAPEGYTISDEMKKGLQVEVTKSDTDKVELTVKNNENVFTKFRHLILNQKDDFTYNYCKKTNSGIIEVSNDPVTTDVHPSDHKDTDTHLIKTVDGRSEEVKGNHDWKSLPAYEDGHKVTYTVTETPHTGDNNKTSWNTGVFGVSMLVLFTVLLYRKRYN